MNYILNNIIAFLFGAFIGSAGYLTGVAIAILAINIVTLEFYFPNSTGLEMHRIGLALSALGGGIGLLGVKLNNDRRN